MATTDPILTAITRLEERLVERIDEWRRELNQRLDRVEQKYERVQGIESRRPPQR